MNNKRKQWGLYRVKASGFGFAPHNLVGTFVGLGSELYATRAQAHKRMKWFGLSSFELEIKKFNPRKDKL